MVHCVVRLESRQFAERNTHKIVGRRYFREREREWQNNYLQSKQTHHFWTEAKDVVMDKALCNLKEVRYRLWTSLCSQSCKSCCAPSLSRTFPMYRSFFNRLALFGVAALGAHRSGPSHSCWSKTTGAEEATNGHCVVCSIQWPSLLGCSITRCCLFAGLEWPTTYCFRESACEHTLRGSY